MSRPDRLFEGDRDVSPVVGVILLVAIGGLLAPVLASLAMSFEGKLRDPAPAGGFEAEFAASGVDNTDDRPYVTISHEVGRTVDGDNIIIRGES